MTVHMPWKVVSDVLDTFTSSRGNHHHRLLHAIGRAMLALHADGG